MKRARLVPFILAPIVLLIHGFHPFAGDAGIYIAGVRHLLAPSLYPVNAVFVDTFARASIFAHTLALLVRFTHLPFAWILLATHLVSIALFLTAARAVANRVFDNDTARWCAILLAAAAFSLPVAGTALPLMDPYVTPRSFSTPLALFAVAACLDPGRPSRTWLRTTLLLALAMLLHPLMGAYAAAFVILLALARSGRIPIAIVLCAVSFIACGAAFAYAHRFPIDPAYRQAVSLAPRSFLFLARWQWFEILGLVLPLLLFALALRKCGRASAIGSLCVASLLAGLTSIAIAAAFVPPAGPYPLVPLQVLRNFHVIYAIGVVLCGGALAALMNRSRIAGAGVLLAICAAMFAPRRASWPGSQSIDWPGSSPSNPYQQAFLWIRDSTPRDAVFAFNPQLVYEPNEDEQGFRAIAERDHLADDKDAGVVAVVPSLAPRWAAQRNAEASVDSMTDAGRRAVLTPLGVNWLLLSPKAPTSLPCPYRNAAIQVCEMLAKP